MHLTKLTKGVLGVGAAIGIGALLYSLFKRNGPTLIPSSPSEWALSSFTTTQDFLAPAPPPVGTPMGPPVIGTWGGDVAVTPPGSSCTSTASCGMGLVCINGSCRPESEWDAS